MPKGKLREQRAKTKVNNVLRFLANDRGFVAKYNWYCCAHCAWGRIDEKHPGQENVVFYTEQDGSAAFTSNGYMVSNLYLSWSGNAKAIVLAFQHDGFEVEWNGNEDRRICILCT